MKTLSSGALSGLRARGVRVPPYDRARIATGVVHFGPGAFHRVHQACFLDDALADDVRWGICAVSLQSPGVRDALAPQDGLYTVAVLDAQPRYRVVGAIRELLVARESPSTVLRRLTDPAVHLVTATVTEKGYCLTPEGGLDFEHPAVQHDLQRPDAPVTLVGYLTTALQQRREAGIPPPNIVTCDNLVDNGRRLRRAVIELAARRDAELAAWIAGEVAFPCTMVDSITPATDDALRRRVARHLGVRDRWPVQREPFVQWVIEDRLRAPTPDFASCGVAVTDDVSGYERAKLRLLNGAHSALAYLGSLVGLVTVAEAMRTPALTTFVEGLMMDDIRPGIVAPRGLDLQAYVQTVLQRFRNPAIHHRLAQIAWDGSQKIPFRLLGTVAENLAAGRPIDRLCLAIAAWFQFVRRKARDGDRLVDPLHEVLHAVGAQCNGDASHDVDAFLTLPGVFPASLAASDSFREGLRRAYRQLDAVTTIAGLESLLDPAANFRPTPA